MHFKFLPAIVHEGEWDSCKKSSVATVPMIEDPSLFPVYLSLEGKKTSEPQRVVCRSVCVCVYESIEGLGKSRQGTGYVPGDMIWTKDNHASGNPSHLFFSCPLDVYNLAVCCFQREEEEEEEEGFVSMGECHPSMRE